MIYLLTQRWQEPSSGSSTVIVELTTDEASKVQETIDWLVEHGGDEVGGALPAFVLFPQPNLHIKNPADHTGLDAVMALLAQESRYEEDRTFYHETERHPLLEAACTSPGYWL